MLFIANSETDSSDFFQVKNGEKQENPVCVALEEKTLKTVTSSRVKASTRRTNKYPGEAAQGRDLAGVAEQYSDNLDPGQG